jgi:uncharacterized membrane protein YesL
VQPKVAEGQRTESSKLPIQVGRAVWSNLPLLLVMDAALFVGAIPVIALFFGGGSVLAPLVGALTLGPLWAGTVATTDRMIRDEAAGLQTFAENALRYARQGVVVALVPAIILTSMLGTLAILDLRPDERWMFVLLLVDGSMLALASLAGLSVFSLATTGGLSGWTLWRASLETVVVGPVTTLGTVALLILLGFLISWAPGFLPVLPTVLAVYLSAATWATVERWRERLEKDGGPE